MRVYFCVVFLVLILSGRKGTAQDLIVTNVGDSISCHIRKETRTEVHFSYTRYNQEIFHKFGKDRVSAIVYGFYVSRDSLQVSRKNTVASGKEDRPEPGNLTINQTTRKDTLAWIKWQTGVHVGYTRRLFRSALSATDYERLYDQKLKPGISAGADVFYFPWKSVGLGMRYDLYSNRAERDIRTHDHVTIQFLGLGVAHRKMFPNQSTAILTSFMVGYQPYRNRTRYIGQDYKLSANTMGWAVSVGIDHRIAKKLAVGLTGNCMLGNVFKFNKTYKGRTEVVNLSHHELEDLSRASITLALRFVQ